MKIAFAGKGGVGKTSLTAWTADYLARQGNPVWLVDADTALSLGQACGVDRDALPAPLIQQEKLINQRIGSGMIHLTPEVADLPETLSLELPPAQASADGPEPGDKRLLVMGSLSEAGGGCACGANALLKALLAHIVLDRDEWTLVDLEAGVEHLGRGTVAHVDGLVIVSDPSRRGLDTAAQIGRMATDLGLTRQVLVINRTLDESLPMLPEMDGLPSTVLVHPQVPGLVQRQLLDTSVLGLPETPRIDAFCAHMIKSLATV